LLVTNGSLLGVHDEFAQHARHAWIIDVMSSRPVRTSRRGWASSSWFSAPGWRIR